jgi:CheY-like chemotaxis protein
VKLQNPGKLTAVLAKDTDFDVIFLDLEMPGVHGYKILDSLQANSDLRSAPVVAYTVHVSEINDAKNQGFHSFLGKPLNADLFPEQLSRILMGERVWETP